MSFARLSSVKIVAFQSIDSTTIDLGQVTVVAGPGDAGKSAILRAIRAAFLNDGNDRDIRHGEKQCSVELDFDDGKTVIWWKEKGKGGCYTIAHPPEEGEDGCRFESFQKTGGAVPDEIQEIFGVAEVELGPSNTVTPQLSDQFDTPFVLGESGSKRARIIGKATRLDLVVTAQAACKTSGDAHKRDAATAEQQGKEAQEQLEALPNIEEYDGLARTLTGVMDELDIILTVARRGRKLHEELEVVRSRLSAVDVSKIDLVPAQEALNRAERVERVVGPYLQAREQVVSVDVPDLSNAVEVLEQARTISIRTEMYLVSVSEFQEAQRDQSDAATIREVVSNNYIFACNEAGVCTVCLGLEDHTECAV